MEDAQIIALFVQRSPQAIGELDKKYGKLCHRLAYNIVNSREDAEECVNDAYLGVWNAIPPAKPDPLVSYLVKVVRNVSLKACQHRQAAKRNGGFTVAMEELEGCVSDGKTVEDEVEAKELARFIESFLDTLTVKERVIFMRRYGFLDSYGEIARRVGISEKNVSVRLSRMRWKLRDYLREREVQV